MDGTIVAAVALVAVALIGLAVAPVSATIRAALLFGACALAALASPAIALLAAVAVAAAFVVDAIVSGPRPVVHRHLPGALARGVGASLTLDAEPIGAGSLRLRQPLVPDVAVEPAEADGRLDARVRAGRRGRHTLPSPAARVRGPLGLAAWYRRGGEPDEVLVYPDLPAAWRLVARGPPGPLPRPGPTHRGPLGLGTDFESIRDYLPDDDIRQVNWRATARLGRPMSNQYRVEQDRDVVCMLDVGRLMAAPLGDRTRLDAAVDAGHDGRARRRRSGRPRRRHRIRRPRPPSAAAAHAAGGRRRARDLRRRADDGRHGLRARVPRRRERQARVRPRAHRSARGSRRPTAPRRDARARAPARGRRRRCHRPRPRADGARAPRAPADVYAAAVALDVLDARARVAARLRHAGADVVEARPDLLPTACVGAYLRAKARARL